MPPYGWMKLKKLDPATVQAHMDALSMKTLCRRSPSSSSKTEMDALVAYAQQLGHAVEDPRSPALPPGGRLPFGSSPQAMSCALRPATARCVTGTRHAAGSGPSFTENTFLAQPGYGTDGEYFAIISGGSDAKKAIGRPGLPDGGMEAFGSQIPPDGI